MSCCSLGWCAVQRIGLSCALKESRARGLPCARAWKREGCVSAARRVPERTGAPSSWSLVEKGEEERRATHRLEVPPPHLAVLVAAEDSLLPGADAALRPVARVLVPGERLDDRAVRQVEEAVRAVERRDEEEGRVGREREGGDGLCESARASARVRGRACTTREPRSGYPAERKSERGRDARSKKSACSWPMRRSYVRV